MRFSHGLIPRFFFVVDCAMNDEDGTVEKGTANIDVFVAEYLRRKGYTKALEALQEAATVVTSDQGDHTEEQIVNVLKYQNEEARPTVYDACYKAFKNWAQTSLDMYRPELLSM